MLWTVGTAIAFASLAATLLTSTYFNREFEAKVSEAYFQYQRDFQKEAESVEQARRPSQEPLEVRLGEDQAFSLGRGEELSFLFVPPSDAVYRIDLRAHGGDADPVLALAQETDNGTVEVSRNDDHALLSRDSRIEATLFANRKYRLSAAELAGSAGNFSLSVTEASEATQLLEPGTSLKINLLPEASEEVGLRLDEGGLYRIDLVATRGDPVLYLYSRGSSGPRLQARDDDGGGRPNSQLVEHLRLNTNYTLRVSEFLDNGGQFTLSIELIKPPSVEPGQARTFTLRSSEKRAFRVEFEPGVCYQIDLQAFDRDEETVWAGDPFFSLFDSVTQEEIVIVDDGGENLDSRHRLRMESERTFHIVASQVGSEGGRFRLSVETVDPGAC